MAEVRYYRKQTNLEVKLFEDQGFDFPAQLRAAHELAAWMLIHAKEKSYPTVVMGQRFEAKEILVYLHHSDGSSFSFGAISPGDFVVFEGGFWNVYDSVEFSKLFGFDFPVEAK